MAAPRVHGPYPHHGRWRVVGVSPDGGRLRAVFDRREDAQAYADNARSALGHRTCAAAVTAYLAHLESKGRRPGTITTARYRLVAFLRLVSGERLLADLTPSAARALYVQRVAEVRADTHRGELALARTWIAWCVKQGWISGDPWEGVEPEGIKARGKPQLRVDEARRFLACALGDSSPAGLACALAMLTGARASEITDRIVRDLDDGGRLLWIPTAKTAAGIRQLAIPEVLRARMLAQVQGRAPGDRIWGDITRHWLGHHVGRFCAAAGVPRVSPHGLRGLYATLRVQSGAAVEAVAAELGQAGPGVTRAHYLAPGAEAGPVAALLGRVDEPADT